MEGMRAEAIRAALSPENPWGRTMQYYDSISSTNDVLKQIALQGAPHGTILIADRQTGGRGRLGRSFLSPANVGIYMSVLLRPECSPDALMHLTCASAVAMCEAIRRSIGLQVGIKWTNDIVFEKKKLSGILTEMSLNQQGRIDYAVIGIGVNCCQKQADFPPEIQGIAGSLAMAAQKSIDRNALAAAMTDCLWEMSEDLLSQKDVLMERYRRHCITLGKEISVCRADTCRRGRALDIDSEGALIVRYDTGEVETVNSGEVSIRGMYGYT